MGITGAAHNATSGLAATTRLIETVSNNVSNALTTGYARRTTETSSALFGGVRIGVTTRAESVYLTSERRVTDASVGAAGARSSAYERLMTAIGDSEDTHSLASIVSDLDTALSSAAATPTSNTKLTLAVDAARGISDKLNAISSETQRLRSETDAEIGKQVNQVNEALAKVEDLNTQIRQITLQGGDATSLQDERGRVIDGISGIIPLRTVSRENGVVAVYSANGGVLLDGRVMPLQFTPSSGPVTAEDTVGSGLSGLSQERGASTGPSAVAVGSGSGPFDGGSLAALFEVRDVVAPQVNAEIDAYAEELIDRFTSLMPTSALDATGNGLFVDGGVGGTAGLAGRIAINSAVDPDQGGAAWRLRDGLGATVQGPSGNGAVLQTLNDALTAKRDTSAFASQTGSADAGTIASEITSFFAGRAERSDEDKAFATARQSTLSEQELSETGVNRNSELQTMMLIEQAYAANAKVLSTVDELFKRLLEI